MIFKQVLKSVFVSGASVMALGLGGCAAVYVDGNLPETQKSEFRKPQQPPAVQLAFEFQTKRVANARATELLKARVVSQVQESGLFSVVSDGPAPGAGLLSITVNNVPLTDDAAAKGFVTGLTFGLAGNTVADGYDATLRYTPPLAGGSATRIQGKHVIHTAIGTGSPPVGAIKTSGGEEAVTLMLRQLLSRLLSDLSRDPAFPSAQPAAQAAQAAKEL